MRSSRQRSISVNGDESQWRLQEISLFVNTRPSVLFYTAVERKNLGHNNNYKQNSHCHHYLFFFWTCLVFFEKTEMLTKIPNCSGNSFVESDSIDDSVDDIDDTQDSQFEDESGREYFEEYEWMAHQESHDEEFMRRLEEEELSNECVEEMDKTVLLEQLYEVQHEMRWVTGWNTDRLVNNETFYRQQDHWSEYGVAIRSNLNPFAKEFVPSSRLVKN